MFIHESRMQKAEAWIELGPRFLQADADSLRLKILQDVESRQGMLRDVLLKKMDELTVAVNDLKLELARHTASTVLESSSPAVRQQSNTDKP